MKMLSLGFVLLQANLKGTINEVLSDYGIPIAGVLILLSAVIGVISNLDKIMDSEGRGTRKEGLMAVVYIMLGVVVAIVVIGAIIGLIGGLSLKV